MAWGTVQGIFWAMIVTAARVILDLLSQRDSDEEKRKKGGETCFHSQLKEKLSACLCGTVCCLLILSKGEGEGI